MLSFQRPGSGGIASAVVETYTTIIWERTRDNTTRGNRGHQWNRNTKKVNMRGQTAIPPGPGKTQRRRVEMPPYVNHAAVLEQILGWGGAVKQGDRGARARPILRAIKHLIEITTKNCRDRGINLGVKVLKELILCRVVIGCIYTADTKQFTRKKKIQLANNNQKHHTNAVFILNVNYIQLNYGSIYHTPFNFIQLWFCPHLWKFK